MIGAKLNAIFLLLHGRKCKPIVADDAALVARDKAVVASSPQIAEHDRWLITYEFATDGVDIVAVGTIKRIAIQSARRRKRVEANAIDFTKLQVAKQLQ